MLSLRRFVLACPLAMLLGCATAGPDFRRPDAAMVAGYAMTGDPQPASITLLKPGDGRDWRWWTAFRSAQLDDLVEQALSSNPTLAAAAAALDQVSQMERYQDAASGLQIDATGAAKRERINAAAFGFEGYPSPTINVFSIGTSLKYDLDLFGRSRRASEAAGARTAAQAQRTRAAYLNLTGAVVARTIELAALRTQADTLEQIIEADKETIEMIRRGIQAGGSPAAALNAAEAQLAEDEARRPMILRRLYFAQHALALLVGKSPAEWSAPVIRLSDLALPSSVPVALPSELVRLRPDILAAESDLHAATASIGVAEADAFPNVVLEGAFAITALHPEDIFSARSSGWALGPALAMPLFDSGKREARRLAMLAAAREADAQYRQTVLSAFVQISDLLSGIATDQDMLAALARSQQVARESARLASLGYQAGAGSLLQVIDAQRQLQRAQLASIDAEALIRADMAALFVATATDWRTVPGPAPGAITLSQTLPGGR